MKNNDVPPKHSNGRVLTWILAMAVAFVASAVGWVGWNCIDSVQKHADEMQKFYVTDENTKIDSSHLDIVKNDIDSHVAMDQLTPGEDLQIMLIDQKSSERVFSKALAAEERQQYPQSVKYYSQVLEMIPAEAKTKTAWMALGEMRERSSYTDLTLRKRAQVYLLMGQYSRAIDDCSAAIKLTPSQSNNYKVRAKAYYKLGHKALGDGDTKSAEALATANAGRTARSAGTGGLR
jgi:tetratricopeptide (TPR) repeat protein